MPKTLLTETQRRADAAAKQRIRTSRIIDAALASRGWDKSRLAEKSGISYQKLLYQLRGDGPMKLPDLIAVCDALGLDAKTRAALCGDKTPCRFEISFMESV